MLHAILSFATVKLILSIAGTIVAFIATWVILKRNSPINADFHVIDEKELPAGEDESEPKNE